VLWTFTPIELSLLERR